MKRPSLKPGDKIKFSNAKRAFPVVATNEKFTVCAYPLTGALSEHKFVYTIIDWEREIRGPDNLIFGPAYNYLDPKDAKKALRDIGPGRMFKRGNVWHEPKLQISTRRSRQLDFAAVLPGN